MGRFLKSLRRGRGEHRQVFAEFAMALMFLHAGRRVRQKGGARLRVVR